MLVLCLIVPIACVIVIMTHLLSCVIDLVFLPISMCELLEPADENDP